jgi:hypothetical protein
MQTLKFLNHHLTHLLVEQNLENGTKKLHFQEIDWVIYFPNCNSGGKYRDYNVIFEDRKAAVHSEEQRKLGEVLDKAEIDRNYPHTVGFYKVSSGEGASFKPEYLELRKIQTVEEFWEFLNALDI